MSMIENERQKQAAERQIAYWKTQIAEQSWLAGERARKEIMRVRTQIVEYDRRQAPKTTTS